MNKLTILIIAVLLLIVPASAEQVEEWPYGMRNVMPIDVTGVMYDFEEGSNCGTFNNQYPTIAAFMSVLTSQLGWSADMPSYMTVGGSMCGTGRCYMNIYPRENNMDWIYVVNGKSAFAPVRYCTGAEGGCLQIGEGIPGQKAAIEFKDGTNYISFLVSTGNDLKVKLYNVKGNNYNLIHYETITVTYDRVNGEPSNFTQFSFRSNVDIDRMELSGPFNAWNIDDLIVGGGPYYLPDEPNPESRDYSWAAERLKTLLGVNYLEFGIGYNLVMGDFYTADEIINTELPYWNPETKELEFGTGINDEGAIVWAFNQDDDLVNWGDIDNQIKHDFKVVVEYGDQKPGDVFFIDYNADSCYNEVGMFIEPVIIDGQKFDAIRIIPEEGVTLATSESLNFLYGEGWGAFFDIRRLPDNPKGGHSPYPKVPTKSII